MIGPHLGLPTFSEALGAIQRWKPQLILVNNPGQGAGGLLRSRMRPDGALVGRVAIEDHTVEGNIRADWRNAASWAENLIVHHATGNPEITHFQITNEILQETPQDLALLGQFSLELAERLSHHRLKLAAFGFSSGQPRLPTEGAHWQEIQKWWERLLELDSWLLIHEYWDNPATGPDGDPWNFGRFENKVKPHLDSRFHNAPYLLGEVGLDLRRDRLGWRNGAGYGGNVAAYGTHILLAAERMKQWRGCLGGALFTLGG